MRVLAEEAALQGVPALRFDYAGTGDSAELEPAANQLDVWTQDVVAAVAEMRRRTGVKRVCLLGIRLGTLIAARAANDCAAVSALILIAPLMSGQRYLRELRRTQMASSLRAPPGGSDGTHVTPPGSLEVGRSFLSAATVSALGNADLTIPGASPISDVLVIDRNDLPVAQAWTDGLATRAIRSVYINPAGFVEMVLTAPQFSIVPSAMVAAVQRMLTRLQPPSSSAGPEEPAGHEQPGSGPASMSLPGVELLPGATITERPVFFGSRATLFGIVTEPRAGERRRRIVIFVNAGADYHIGANGMYAWLARHWARRGYFVLRMDLAGLGDSGTRPGREADEEFPPAALDDMRAAVELMSSRYGAREITLAGLCSGAYHCLRAAVAGLPLNRVLLINPQNYFWSPGASVKDMQVAELISHPVAFKKRFLSRTTWRKLLEGKLDVRYITRIYLSRLALVLESTVREWARRARIRLPHDLGWEIEDVASRGIRMVFLFSSGAPGLDLLRMQAGGSLERAARQCHIRIVERADHTFIDDNSKAALRRILSQELEARNQWIAAAEGAQLKVG